MKKPNTVDAARALIEPILRENGMALWDVRFEKEGGQWYLRYFIERIQGSLTIEDCERASRAVEKLLDREDPIEQSYILEVGSPGIERELVRDWHFERYIGHEVAVRTIRPVDGKRDFKGKLLRHGDGEIVIGLPDGEMILERSKTAFIKLHVDFDDGGKRG
ncbi:MAG: ribosome maturation factor RimP [Oscillospiraceae bacterium]|nr:ribosome maturation factor RimP [Oscillospiraceae bacterium]